MGSGVKVGGSWKTPGNIWTKVGGTWKQVAQTWTKVGGTWKVTTFGEPPAGPIMEWNATSKFYITNPVVGATYTTTLSEGSGTVSPTSIVCTSTNPTDPSNIFTLTPTSPATRVGFNVYAQWAVGAPQATKVGNMVRQLRTQDYVYLRTDCQTCCSPNQRATCNTAPYFGSCPNPEEPGCPCKDQFGTERCICWAFGPPYCSSCNCRDIYGYVDHNWAPDGFTDRTSEWEKST